jgi:anti-anti-sigma regulatory factor
VKFQFQPMTPECANWSGRLGIRQVACHFEQDENSIAIRLEGAVNIADAAELKGMLQEAFGSDQELRLDLKEATDLDICILQLICCAD